MPVTPPLRVADASRGERHGRSVGSGRCLKFVRETVGADRHRRASVGTDAIDVVLAAHVVRAGGKVNPLAVARPGVELLGSVVERQALQFIGRQREDVNVASAGPCGHERQLRAVRRIERSRLFGRMRDQYVCFTPARGSHPNVATGNKRNLRTSRTQRRFREIRSARGTRKNGDEREKCQDSHDSTFIPHIW